jgi:hypothetical protein
MALYQLEGMKLCVLMMPAVLAILLNAVEHKDTAGNWRAGPSLIGSALQFTLTKGEPLPRRGGGPRQIPVLAEFGF